jgi:hypothetical protein
VNGRGSVASSLADALRMVAEGANRDAIGAWVEVRAGDRVTTIETTVGGGHVSGQLGWIHVGLGDADRAEVTVTWPDGESGPSLSVEADTFVVVEEGATAIAPWTPEQETEE